MKKYILDTNVYISAYREYYSSDICPSYWSIIFNMGKDKIINSPLQVKEEIERKDDDLSKWAKNQNPCFAKTNPTNIHIFFRKVSDAYHVVKKEKIAEIKKTRKNYREPIKESVSDEDLFVIANALFFKDLGNDVVLVTKENLKSVPRKPVRIPHVCQKLGVLFINDFDFIRETKIKFTAVRN